MDRADGPNDVPEDLGALEVVLGDRVALHEARDEAGALGHPDDDLGADSRRRRCASGLDLGLAVDPEELGVAAGQPQNESVVARADQEVAVRDARGDRRDLDVVIAPDGNGSDRVLELGIAHLVHRSGTLGAGR